MQDQQPITKDYFNTIKSLTEAEYKEKGSKFLAFAFPVKSTEDVKETLHQIKKQYFDARHHCYAYRLNPEDPQIRANDDGEPSHSAGTPIYNQLLSFDLWNILVVVVRYFGGTKLGVSGLINAYKTATHVALEKSKTKEILITQNISIDFPYKLMNDIMRLIKDEEIQITQEQMGINAGYILAIRKNSLAQAVEKLEAFHELKITYL